MEEIASVRLAWKRERRSRFLDLRRVGWTSQGEQEVESGILSAGISLVDPRRIQTSSRMGSVKGQICFRSGDISQFHCQAVGHHHLTMKHTALAC